MSTTPTTPLFGSDHDAPRHTTFLGPEDAAKPLEATIILEPTPAWHALTSAYVGGPPQKRFLTYDELARHGGPDPDVVAAITGYVRGHGLTVREISPAARTIRVAGTAAQMTAAFAARLEAHAMNGRRHTVQRGPLRLPADLAGYVHTILGLDDRPAVTRPRSHAAAAAGGTAAVTAMPPYPATLVADLYGFPAATGKGRRIALIEFGGGYSTAILDAYFRAIPGGPAPSVTSVAVLGAQNDPGSQEAIEVLLDIEVAGAVAPEAEYLLVFAPNDFSAWVHAIDAALAWSGGAPDVISISWGGPEQSWPAAARTACDQALQAAAAAGVTVFVSAGDSGVNPQNGVPTVWYPAASALAVSCGGTTIRTSSSTPPKIASEVVWNDNSGATGGGISTTVPRPAWQKSLAMPATLVAGGPAGRGVPDLAADASADSGYQMLLSVNPPVWIPGGGTSAVAPLYAALVARLAELRGKPLGYITPTLYATPGAFVEITEGNNSFDDVGGYSAGPGWNACTGLGRPDGSAWKTLFVP